MTVIAAVDGAEASSNVVKHAGELAEGLGDELLVLHVMSEDQYEAISEGPRLIGGQWDISYARYVRQQENYTIEDAESDAEKVAEEVASSTLPAGTSYETRGSVGDPSEMILSVVDREDTSYLVMGGRKRTPVGKALFGSVSQSVLLNAHCPVVTVMTDES